MLRRQFSAEYDVLESAISCILQVIRENCCADRYSVVWQIIDHSLEYAMSVDEELSVVPLNENSEPSLAVRTWLYDIPGIVIWDVVILSQQ